MGRPLEYREPLAYRAVGALAGARDELQQRVADEIASWATPPVSVVLYGSAVRQQETVDSDIDLLVLRPTAVSFDDPVWAVNVVNLSERVGRWCGSPCNILEYSTEELTELKRMNDPSVDSLLRDGIVFTGEHDAVRV